MRHLEQPGHLRAFWRPRFPPKTTVGDPCFKICSRARNFASPGRQRQVREQLAALHIVPVQHSLALRTGVLDAVRINYNDHITVLSSARHGARYVAAVSS